MLYVLYWWLIETQSPDVVQRLHSLIEMHFLSVRLLFVIAVYFSVFNLLLVATGLLIVLVDEIRLGLVLVALWHLRDQVLEAALLCGPVALHLFLLLFGRHWVVFLSDHRWCFAVEASPSCAAELLGAPKLDMRPQASCCFKSTDVQRIELRGRTEKAVFAIERCPAREIVPFVIVLEC